MADICIICHETEGLQRMPCECRGTSGHVHASCLEAMRRMPAWTEHCPQCKCWWLDLEPWFYQPAANMTREEMRVLSLLLQFPVMLWLTEFLGSLFWASLLTEGLGAVLRLEFGSGLRSFVAPTTAYCAALLNADLLLGLYIWLSVPLGFVGPAAQRLGVALCASQALLCVPVLLEVIQRLVRLRYARPAVERCSTRIPSPELLKLWQWQTRFKQNYLLPIIVDFFTLWRRSRQPNDRAQVLERLRNDVAQADKLQFPKSGEPAQLASLLRWLPFPQPTLKQAMLSTAALALGVAALMPW